MRERERETACTCRCKWKRDRERERGRERIPSRLHAISAEPDVALDLTDLKIMT